MFLRVLYPKTQSEWAYRGGQLLHLLTPFETPRT
jgi:hypothetical protein